LITAYRIAKKKYAADPLGGSGGLRSGGRWHHKGARIVYCAENLSLAELEFFIHFGRHQRKISLVSFEVSIPVDLIETLTVGKLPADWRTVPPPDSTAKLGMEWLIRAKDAVLRVPSALTPGEHNYLINPTQKDAAKISTGTSRVHVFDSIIWK
jgi:RES domain-containing protein